MRLINGGLSPSEEGPVPVQAIIHEHDDSEADLSELIDDSHTVLKEFSNWLVEKNKFKTETVLRYVSVVDEFYNDFFLPTYKLKLENTLPRIIFDYLVVHIFSFYPSISRSEHDRRRKGLGHFGRFLGETERVTSVIRNEWKLICSPLEDYDEVMEGHSAFSESEVSWYEEDPFPVEDWDDYVVEDDDDWDDDDIFMVIDQIKPGQLPPTLLKGNSYAKTLAEYFRRLIGEISNQSVRVNSYRRDINASSLRRLLNVMGIPGPWPKPMGQKRVPVLEALIIAASGVGLMTWDGDVGEIELREALRFLTLSDEDLFRYTVIGLLGGWDWRWVPTLPEPQLLSEISQEVILYELATGLPRRFDSEPGTASLSEINWTLLPRLGAALDDPQAWSTLCHILRWLEALHLIVFTPPLPEGVTRPENPRKTLRIALTPVGAEVIPGSLLLMMRHGFRPPNEEFTESDHMGNLLGIVEKINEDFPDFIPLMSSVQSHLEAELSDLKNTKHDEIFQGFDGLPGALQEQLSEMAEKILTKADTHDLLLAFAENFSKSTASSAFSELPGESSDEPPQSGDWKIIQERVQHIFPASDRDWGSKLKELQGSVNSNNWWGTIPFGVAPEQPVLTLSGNGTIKTVAQSLFRDKPMDPISWLHLIILSSQ